MKKFLACLVALMFIGCGVPKADHDAALKGLKDDHAAALKAERTKSKAAFDAQAAKLKASADGHATQKQRADKLEGDLKTAQEALKKCQEESAGSKGKKRKKRRKKR